MSHLLERLIRENAKAVISSFIALAVVAAYLATGITIDGSVQHLMMSNDPAKALDRLAKEEFGNDEILMVALDLGAPYTEQDLRKLDRLSTSIAALEGVEEVKSLATTEDIRGTEDELDASPLVELETLAEDFAAIQQRTRSHRLYNDLLISPEQDVFGLAVHAENADANSEAMNDLVAAVIGIVEQEAPPWKAYFAGYPVTAFEVNRIVKQDLARLTPAALVAISIILIGFTRRVYPIGILLALIVWVEAVAFAWLSLRGIPLNVVVSILPTVMLATSGTYVIYSLGILAHVSHEADAGVALAKRLARPVILSGLSTAVGFASLTLIDVEAIGDLGSALAVGILAATIGSLLLIPALVQTFGLRLMLRQHNLMERLSLIGVAWAKRPWVVVTASALLLAAALPGISRIHLNTDTLDYFAPDNFIREGSDFFEEKLASAFLMNFVLRAEEPSRALDADVLDFTEELVAELEAMPQIDRTISMLDYFYLMDASLRFGEEPRANPGSREVASQYLLLYEAGGDPEDYDRYINFERSALSILVSAHGGSSAYIEAADQIAQLAARKAPVDLAVDSLGSMFLYSRAMDSLTRGMLLGLGLAAFLVGIVMVVGLRSFRWAAIAAIPNITPLLLSAGVLGWMGVPLSMSTSIVGCLALGLAVDDTAHVMGHLRPEHALDTVFGEVGPAVLLTTLSLGVGFLALTLSDFQTVKILGIATTATLGLALLADLLLLPSLLVLAGHQRVEKDLVPIDSDSND